MTEIVPRDAIAAWTRQEIAGHDDWDSAHTFQTLHWKDGKIRIGLCAILDPALEPRSYPKLLSRLMASEIGNLSDDPKYGGPPVAFMLQIETWSADADAHPPGAVAQAHRDNAIDKLPGAVENALALTVDVHGRVYSATRRRDTGEVSEEFHGPGGGSGFHGALVACLEAIAGATAITCHHLLPAGPRSPFSSPN